MTQIRTKSALRCWRERQSKTQEECAAKVGTSRHVWSDWERGRRIPNRQFMPRILALTEGEVHAGDFYPQLEQAA